MMSKIVLDIQFCDSLSDKDFLARWYCDGSPEFAYNKLYFTLNGKKVYFDEFEIDKMFYSMYKKG